GREVLELYRAIRLGLDLLHEWLGRVHSGEVTRREGIGELDFDLALSRSNRGHEQSADPDRNAESGNSPIHGFLQCCFSVLEENLSVFLNTSRFHIYEQS